MKIEAPEVITQKGIETLKSINYDEIEPMNKEQKRVIEKLEVVLNLLRSIEIKNEDSLAAIDKPFDEILNKLKYLPTNPSFGTLPTEIKTDIFSYLCDSRAFVAASVSQEWKIIMETRLNKMEEVTIGKHCSNQYQCQGYECFVPEEILKASIVLKTDIPLSVCHPLSQVDSSIIIESLSQASNLSIQGECSCVEIPDENDENYRKEPILTMREFRKMFNALNLRSEMMNSLKLVELDLSSLNQTKLVDCLLSKTISLTLNGGEFHQDDELVNFNKLVKGLLQVPQDCKLKQLNLHNLTLYNGMVDDEDFMEDEDYADAICNVHSVHLDLGNYIDKDLPKRLIDNILNRPITLKKIKISEKFKWRKLIEPDDLKILIEKMTEVDLIGVFSPEQVEAVGALPRVKASVKRITKDEID